MLPPRLYFAGGITAEESRLKSGGKTLWRAKLCSV